MLMGEIYRSLPVPAPSYQVLLLSLLRISFTACKLTALSLTVCSFTACLAQLAQDKVDRLQVYCLQLYCLQVYRLAVGKTDGYAPAVIKYRYSDRPCRYSDSLCKDR